MAVDFDNFPFYNDVLKEDTNKLSDIWRDALATHIQSLIGYLTQYGILLPQLTTKQRDTIQSPVLGQMIYNTTLNSAQYFKLVVGVGTWVSF